MPKAAVKLNRAVARKVLATVDAGLVKGLGKPVPGQMCVEAAVNYALGHDHGDDPSCVGSAVRAFKIRLNDAAWPTDKDRTEGMRKLAIAQLGSDEIDQKEFSRYVAIETVKRLLPITLRFAASLIPKRKDALEGVAAGCEAVVDLLTARAAARAAQEKANEARSYAASAAYADASAAYASAAYADAGKSFLAKRLEILRLSAQIGLDALQHCGSKGVKWLDLCDE